jgi:hypothetical protein
LRHQTVPIVMGAHQGSGLRGTHPEKNWWSRFTPMTGFGPYPKDNRRNVILREETKNRLECLHVLYWHRWKDLDAAQNAALLTVLTPPLMHYYPCNVATHEEVGKGTRLTLSIYLYLSIDENHNSGSPALKARASTLPVRPPGIEPVGCRDRH